MPRQIKSPQNFIAVGYAIIVALIGGIISSYLHGWRQLERLETESKQIQSLRQSVHDSYALMLDLTLHGETVLKWEAADTLSYHRKRKAMDSLLCEFKRFYPFEPLDSLRHLLADKERQMIQIFDLLDEQERLNQQLIKRVPVITQKSSQEQGKRNGFLGLFRKKNSEQAETTAMLHTLNRDVVSRQKERENHLSQIADSLAARNIRLNEQLNKLIHEMDERLQSDLQKREVVMNSTRDNGYILIGTLTGFAVLLLIVSYVIIHMDVNQKERVRKKLEESIRQNNSLLEMRKKIILTISHDIRGPLNIINGSAELATDTREKRKRIKHLTTIRMLCKHILHLLNNLLDVYRLNEAKEKLNNMPFRLTELLNHIATGFTHAINNKGLLFSYEFKDADLTVNGDVDRIEQVIDNLLTNAIKFTETGTISFSASYRNGVLTMIVQDTGIGMNKEMLSRLFIPFERAATGMNPEGFGLGLTITKGLVSLMGGNITATSTEGKGSTFTVTLPLPVNDDDIVIEDESIREHSSLRLPQYVLIIDDDPMQLEIAKEMLERNGVTCITCNTVTDVVREMRKHNFDMLLTDIQMPGTNGFELLKLLRKSKIGNSKSIPVIAMTARAYSEKDMLLQNGFSGCLFKPFSTNELLTGISSIMENTENSEFDFSILTSEASDVRRILRTLIESSEKDLKDLEHSVATENYSIACETIHRMYPTWEMLQMESRLQTCRESLRNSGTSKQAKRTHVLNLIKTTERLIRNAEMEIKKLTDEKTNTDS